jgi:NAD(P)H-flavin reductase
MKATIIKIIDETHDTKTFRLMPVAPIIFKPGQFFMVGIDINKKFVTKAYSASSSPLKAYVEVTVKSEPHDAFSEILFQKNVNDEIVLDGPHGAFVFDDESCKEVIFLGAGSGVAPLRSIVQYIMDKKLAVQSSLFFYQKTEKDIIYKEELKRLKKRGFDVNISLTRESNGWQGLKGRVTIEHLRSVIGENNERLFYICGPSDFVKVAKKILENYGITSDKIRHELYD